MIWKNVFSSYRPQRKRDPLSGSIGAALAPAAVNTVGNLVSSLFGQSAQKEENAKNRSFALEMWNLQNAYNSPKNQRKLLEEGGYSPYLFNDTAPFSTAGAVQSPSTSPLPTFQNPVNGSMQLLQNGLQVEANVELQRMKSLETISNVMLNILKDGGQKQLDDFITKFAPTLQSLDWDGSNYQMMFDEQRKALISQRYNTDMDSLLKDFEYESNKEWTNKERMAHFEQMKNASKNLVAQCELWAKEGNYTEEKAKAVASEVARNFAEAFQAKKVGDYYVVNAAQMGIINDMLDLDLEDRKADFAYNTSVRKWKKEIPNRQYAFDTFLLGLKGQQVQLGVQGNKFLQYGKEVTSMVGNLFKVNVGFSNSNANIRSHNRSYSETNNVTPSGFPPVVPISGF